MSGRRMIHDDICEDRKLNAVTEGAEILFYRLLSKTDDFGRYYGDPDLLRAHLFPRRQNLNTQEVTRRLAELVLSGLLLLYRSGDGELIVQFKNFEKRQAFRKDIKRKERFPPPEDVVTPTTSAKLVSDTFGPVSDAVGRVPDAERPVTDSGLKERKGKEREDKSLSRGGEGTSELGTTRDEPVPDAGHSEAQAPSPPPPSAKEDEKLTAPLPSFEAPVEEVRTTVPEGSDEQTIRFLVSTFLTRFPNSGLPGPSVRKQVERALASKLTAQDIYEAFERRAAKSETKADKVWTILDPLISERAKAGAEFEAQGGGLTVDDLQGIAERAVGRQGPEGGER